MELYPAVDVQGGRVVRLQQGAADRATAYADDPVAVAREFAAAGAFPDASRPKTLWIGVAPGEGFDRLEALNSAIEDRLHDQMGFPRERRRFHPHLTIGRVNSGGEAQQTLSEIVQQHAHFDASITEIDEVLIFASYLEKSGPTYNVMGRAELNY